MNDTTRKYPRTIQQAFGPTESSYISEPEDPPMDWQDRIVLIASIVTLVGIALIGLLT